MLASMSVYGLDISLCVNVCLCVTESCVSNLCPHVCTLHIQLYPLYTYNIRYGVCECEYAA